MIRCKYLFENNLETQWQDLDFIRNTNNHPHVINNFSCKTVDRMEQEEWYINNYSKDDNKHIWLVYDEKMMCPVGYFIIDIVSIQNQRAVLNIVINPEFNNFGYESIILGWIKENFKKKIMKKINIPIHKIMYHIIEDNEDMMKTLYKFGFEWDACLRDHIIIKQIWKDVHIMSIINT